MIELNKPTNGDMMEENINIEDMIIAEVIQRWPATAEIFNRYNLACVGCSVSEFCSIATAVDTYGLDGPNFLTDMKEKISQE